MARWEPSLAGLCMPARQLSILGGCGLGSVDAHVTYCQDLVRNTITLCEFQQIVCMVLIILVLPPPHLPLSRPASRST